MLSSDAAAAAELDASGRESLDVRCADETQFARWVAALHTLIAANFTKEGETPAELSARRQAALARAAPGLHDEMQRREAALEAELKAEAEREAERWLKRMNENEAAASSASSGGGGEASSGGDGGGDGAGGGGGEAAVAALAGKEPSEWKIGEMKAALSGEWC